MKKIFSTFLKTLIILIPYLIHAKNICPKWYPMPSNDGLVVVLPIYDATITKADLDCDGIVDVYDSDIDGDGVINAHDDFPRDASESIDTDGDGIGNNADTDDDNDGYYDHVEIVAGSNPLDATDTPENHDVNIHFSNWVRTNPGAGGAINMIGATASGVLVTASDLSGIYISLDKNGTHWDVLGEKNGLMLTTHMSALGFHPTDGNTFYVGTGNGVYMTNNLGQHFDFISSNIPENNNNNNTYVQSIVAAELTSDPSKTVVYVTYHNWDLNSSSKIAKTINNGQTWTDISFPDNLRPKKLRIVKLLVHPQNSNLIYAITGKPRWGCSAPKAYRSEDGGATWHDISNGHDILDLDIDYSNQNILYISTFKAVSCEYVYHDGDADEYQRGEALFDSNGYAIDGKLYKSTNKGDNFGVPIISNQTGTISVGTGHVNNSNNIKLVNLLTFSSAYWMEHDNANTTGTWESNDYGLTWSHVASVTDWEHIGYSDSPYNAYTPSYNGYNKTLTKDLFNSDRLYFAGGWPLATFDGGKIFKSISTKQIDENKDTWKSTGIENINGYVLDVNDNNENVIYMGGYDIGFWVSKDRGLSWKWQNPFKNNLSMQDMYTWGATNHEPKPWEPSSLKTIGGTNVMTLLSDPQHANVVWSSFARAQSFADEDKNRSGLFRSTNYGDTWTLSTIYKKDGTLLNVNYHAVIYGLSVDKSSPVGMRTLYVTIDGDVAKSTDDGRTWHIIHKDGGLKFTDVGTNVLYAGGKNGLWRYKNNIWTQMGGQYKNEMMGIGSPMFKDITPQSNAVHYDKNWNEIIDKYAWNGVHDIQIDPKNSNIVYVVVYRGEGEKDDNGIPITPNDAKGLYKTTNGGNTWSRVNLGSYENKYLRAMTISPHNSNILFLSSSENINSGGAGGTSHGVIYSKDAGITWQEANGGMAWKYAAMIEVDKLNERVWAWSPGTGVQYMEITQ